MRNTSVVAAAASVVLLALYALWFDPGWPLLAAYAALAAVATLTVPALYRASGQTLADEMEWLERREAAEHEELRARLAELGAELGALGIDEGARQATTLTALLDDYHAVVETRFLGKKGAPLEYLATARRVQKLAVQNLTDMVAIGHSLGALGREGEALPETPSEGALEGTAEGERATRRIARTAEQRGRLDALLEENRQLFDALSATAVEVANIPSFSRFERIDTLARLTTLAEIASRRGA